MLLPVCVSAVSLILARAAVAQGDGSAVFINPPPPDLNGELDYSNNPVYTSGATIQLSWSANYTNISLLLGQTHNGFRPVLIDNQPSTGGFQWTVTTDDFQNGGTFSTSPEDQVFQFALYEAPTQNNVVSHWFNISSSFSSTTSNPSSSATSDAPMVGVHVADSPDSTSSATALPSTTDTSDAIYTSTVVVGLPSATSAASTAAAESPSPASPSTPSPASSAGLDASTKMGLAVGLGIGIPLLCLLIAILYVLIWRRGREYKPRGQTWRLHDGSASMGHYGRHGHGLVYGDGGGQGQAQGYLPYVQPHAQAQMAASVQPVGPMCAVQVHSGPYDKYGRLTEAEKRVSRPEKKKRPRLTIDVPKTLPPTPVPVKIGPNIPVVVGTRSSRWGGEPKELPLARTPRTPKESDRGRRRSMGEIDDYDV